MNDYTIHYKYDAFEVTDVHYSLHTCKYLSINNFNSILIKL